MPRFFKKRFRFQTQLLIMLFVFGVVPMALTVAIGYSVSRQTIIDQARSALAELASRQASHLTTEMRRQELILRTIAGQVAAVADGGRTNVDLREMLAGSLTDDGVFDGLRLVSTDGLVSAEVALRETEPEWPDHAPESVVASGVALHLERDSVIAYLLAVPVGAGERLWLEGHVRAEDFSANFDIPLHLLGGVELGVFDDHENVILVPHEHAAGDLKSVLAATQDLPDEVMSTDLASAPALVFGTRLPETGWHMVAALPLSIVLRPVNRVLNLAAVGFGALALLIVVAGLAASRVVTTPLRRLSDAARSFGATGKYENVKHTGVAETEALASSFAAMAENLERSRDEIDRLHAYEMERAQQLATVGELASGVAHEIRNPLTGVLGALEVVSKRLGDDTARPLIDEAEAQLRRIESTTTQLLEYARPPEIRKVDVDMRGVIERAIRVSAPVADQAGVEIGMEVEDGVGSVHADPELLGQVLVNLLLNAIDVSSRGRSVLVRGSTADSTVRVEVSDHGPGIDPEIREDIFRPFFTTKSQGTGLGLSISQQIVARHDGTILIQDSPDGGATFVVVLPRTTKEQ